MSMTEYPCNECGLPGVNRVFDGGGTAYIHHSCPYRICFKCGQREIADMVKHVCPKAEEKDMATANTPETCPCANWSWVVGEYHDRTEHHPNCDGHGKPKTQFVTGMSIAEPELQLLVLDFGDVCGDVCVVKVEQGEWKRDGSCKYRGSVTVTTLPLDRLRDELDGIKPLPRIERVDESYHVWGELSSTIPLVHLSKYSYNALSELAGKPLPIWEGGTWEELGHIDDDVYNNTDLRVWRYKKNA